MSDGALRIGHDVSVESLFGRYEAAALLAVDRANGGELAPLPQVLAAFEGLFGSITTAATFTESLSLLIDARLVEWHNPALGLTVEGRKAIRRSGTPWDAELASKLADRLARIGEEELAPEGELPAPSEEDLEEALKALGRGGFDASGAPAEPVTPSTLAGNRTIGARLLSGLPGGMGVRVVMPGESAAERRDDASEERD